MNGMAAAATEEQGLFATAHPDLYEVSHGATRLRLRNGEVQIGSLNCVGFASTAMPDWRKLASLEPKT
jgi:hypothetical protein